MTTLAETIRRRLTIREQQERLSQQTLLTPTQAALLLQLSPDSLYRKIKRGEIPGVQRFGRTIRINRGVLLAWSRRQQEELR